MRKTLMSRRIGRGFFLISALVAAVPVNHGRAAEPSVEAGFYVSYALTRDGRLYAWGANFHGQLANGTFTTNNPYGSSVPLLVPLPGGGATAWSAVQAGLSHTLALANNGNLYSWGRNDAGELGTGHELVTTSNVEVPKPAGVTRWRAIAAGEEHSVALGDNGQLYGWGDNFYGELGNGNQISRPAPTPVLLPEGVTHWTEVWAGGASTFARGNNGRVYACGRNSGGELGIGTVNSGSPSGVSSPTAVLLPAGVTGWRTISVGRYHTVALDEQGQLFGWGSNEMGGLGYGITGIQSTPLALAAPAGVASWRTLSSGQSHNLAISGDGRLFAWGRGAGNSATTPALLISSRTNWNAIAAGVEHALAVASDCGLYAWGWNYYGALGSDRPSGNSLSTPELVSGLPDLCDTPPGTRELHVVGVHAGAGSTTTYQRGDAAVWVNRPGKRIVLFLSSYSPVRWYINVSAGTILERVILGGYYRQTVEGVGPETEVIPAWFTSGGIYTFIGSSLEDAEFYDARPRLCAMTGLDISSFHGSYVAPYPNSFIIDRVEDDERLRCDYPQPTPASELPPLNFRIAFHDQSPTGNVVFQNYTLAGPQDGERLLPAMRVVPDAAGRFYYGTENHQVWKADSQAGTAQQMILPATVPELSWPTGLAFDSQRNRVLLVSLGGEGYLYAYSPPSNQWSLVRSMANRDLESLEYHPAADVLYSLAVNGNGGRSLIYRLSPDGAVVGEIPLPFIPVRFGPGLYRTELVSVGEYLVLLMEPTYPYPSDTSVQEARIYLIDPRSGQSWLTYRRAYLPETRRPAVQVVWPAEGMAFPAGTTIPLRADASDPDGIVDTVEFFANGAALGRGRRSPDSSATFQLDWPNPLPGSYAVAARATDAVGLSTVSSAVHTSIRQGEPPLPVSERELHAVGISGGVDADGTPLGGLGQGHAAVAVNRPGKGVTLFLSSYNPVLWHVASSNGTVIEKVILGGYYAQAITGLSSNVPVERAYYYDDHDGDYLDIGWTMESGDFYRTVQRLCQRTGLDLASFHGAANPPYPAPFVIDSVQNDARLRCDYPRPVDPVYLPNLSFRLAWNDRSGTIVFKDYALAGPQSGSRLFQSYRVVTDAGGRYYYGAEQHQVWRVDSQTSTVQEMILPSNLPELSWPMGIAFDSLRNRVLAVTLGGEGFLYSYSPAQDQWSLVGSMDNRDVDCLVYHAADDSLYAVTQAYEGASSLLRFNAAGEFQSEIRLPVQPFRVGHGESRSELASVGDYLVLLLETDPSYAYFYPGVQAESRMYLIDPRTSQVSLTYRRILFPDQDDDGVPDDRDRCPNTAAGAVVDANGCSAAQRDTDRDGVPDSIDECPDTPLTARVDSRGCPLPDRCPRLIQWQAGFGTAQQDNPKHIYATADGGYVLGGGTYSNTNAHDFWVVRVDANGNKLWEKRIGGIYGEHFGDLKPLSDGGFIVGGARNRDDNYEFLLVRLDGNGNVLWERTYGGTRLDFITSLDVTADGGFILGGQSDSPADARKSAPLHGRYDYWLVRVDANGNKLWDRSFGGTEAEWLTKVISLADGGFLALGSSDSGANGNKTSANFGQNDAWVVRLDAQGNKIWERAIGGSGTEWLSSGLVLANGFLVVGQSGSPPSGNKTSPHFGGGDAWAVRLDVNGSVLWDGSYGGFGSDGASAVAALEDGGFVLGASSSSVASGNKSWPLLTSQDVWIVGIGASGEKLWDRAFGGGSPAASWLADLIQTADEGFLIASESYAGIGGDKTVPNFGGADAWLFKLPPLDRDCDADGVEDMLDFCPDTPAGSTVDARGCSASQRDSDGDGVTDDRDQCPGTPPEVQQVDANGCSISYPICAPPIQWQETYARDEFQHAQAARQLPDGGYLVLGSVQGINGIGTNAGFGNTDAYVLRIDANGQKLWDRIFGGSSEDSLSAMALLPDGGAVLAGYSASPADGNKTSPRIDGADGWLVRIDANGNKIWDKTFSAGEESFFRDIQRLPDGGFVLAGSANDSDDVGWVVRLNGNGEQLWERQIYHEENSWFNRVLVLPNGDLLAGGANEDDDGEFSFWLARLNPGGEILWERFYGGSGDEELTALLAVDGGFLLGGRSASPADGSKTSPNFGSVDYWIVGVDSGGNQLWDASFGGNGEDYLTDAVAMPNGDFVLGGWSSFSSGGNKRSPVLGQSDYWIVRVDASGQKIWDAAYGGDQGDELLDLELTSGGGLLLSGSSASNLSGNKTAPRRGLGDAWLVKLDSRNGCDLDGDGVPNDRDQCPNTLPGTPVDSRGCAVPPPPPPHCPFAVQWETALRHAGVEQLARVHQTADGGFIVGGTSYGSPAGYWVVRLNAQGSTLWERFFGSGSGSEVLFDLQPTSDGGFVLGGASSSPPFAGKTSPHYGDYDFWLVRIDANGNKLWDRSFGGSGFDGIYGLQQTADGGYILGGVSGSPADGNKTSPHFGSRDFWLVRTDANGNKLWDRSYGGSGTEFWARARQTADGGFVMVGTTDSGADGNKTTPHFGADDIWVVRLDSAGNKLWDQTYGGTLYEYPGEILPTADGGFIVSAWSQSGADGNKTSQSFGESDGWVLRLNGDGSRQWEQAFGGTNSDTLYGLARTSDGGYILGGYSQSGATGNKTSDTGGTWLVRLDANGNKLWDQAVAGGALAEVKQTSDGGFVIAGDGFSNETLVDGWVAKVGPERENCDGDGDGVPDDRDQCPNTRAGTVVNAQGCSIAQLCPCDGPWRNHSEYVQCVMDHAWEFYREGLIDENERKAITRAAVRSNCGRHHDREAVRIHLCPQTRQECQRDGIRVVLSGDVAGDQMIESSTDLINWSPVEAGTATVTGDEILFPVAPDVAARFYRIRIQ